MLVGRDVGDAAVMRSKCSELGVIMPSRDSSGVRDDPLPVVPATGATMRCTATS